jgi:D-amino-acid oxidase
LRFQFQYLPANHHALPPGSAGGAQFKTVTIETPTYLNYLLARFLARGGLIVRGAVQHIHQVIEGGARIFSGLQGSPPDAVIVCAGLGARFLGGVEDKNVYPIRGQTVLLKAPWVKTGKYILTAEGQVDTYVIPRRSGNVRFFSISCAGILVLTLDWTRSF